MKSPVMALVLFFTFISITGFALNANSVHGETAVCPKKNAANADTLHICPTLAVESAIASGNAFVAEARQALYALRDGDDPEFQVPNLHVNILLANLTLADFGVTHEDLASVVNRYYEREVRQLNVYALKDDKKKLQAAFSRIYDIYEKRDALLIFMKDNFAPFPAVSVPRKTE